MGDLPQIREWVRDGKNGYIVSCLNDNDVSEAIIKILSDKGKTNSFIKINLAQVREKADFDKNMKNIENLYEKLITKTKKRR